MSHEHSAAPAATPEQIAAAEQAHVVKSIKAKFNNLVDVKEVKFHFKKQEIKGANDEGTGEFTKRPTVELNLPVPSVEGIVAILEAGGKGLELLQEAVSEIIYNRAREIVNDREDITQDNFPLDTLGWDAIANLPKAERRGGGISKETWEDFGKDYSVVMPSVTGKTAEQIGNAIKIFLAKFNPIKGRKPVILKLKEQLGLYALNSPNAETYADCVDFLNNKADALLSMDDADLLANL